MSHVTLNTRIRGNYHAEQAGGNRQVARYDTRRNSQSTTTEIVLTVQVYETT